MSNKVYYGEYSLDYWIKLILKGNIILPEYQRSFTWDNDKRRKLIQTLKNKEFVPPVIIGAFSKDNQTQNLIIDGQQRLTSILLSCLGYFPDRDKYKKENKNKFIDENDDVYEEKTDVINWSFRDLLEGKESSIDEIKQKLSEDDFFYSIKDNQEIGESFLKNTYLGFSYLVPDNEDNEQQKYYSSVFRHINIQGINLTAEESRESLYYLNEDKKSLFKPDFLESYEGNTIDFVRYISILSQYKQEGTVDSLCKGYGRGKSKMEEFYVDYIESIVAGKENDKYWPYEKLFSSNSHKDELEKLGNLVSETGLYKKNFESIIDIDMYYFGLIYWSLFEKKEYNIEGWKRTKKELEDKIKIYKYPYLDKNGEPTKSPDYKDGETRNYHPKNPSILKYVRERVQKSIDIYKDFFGEKDV